MNPSLRIVISTDSRLLTPSKKGIISIFPYFWPPPVPLTCVCEKPVTTSGIGAQPAFGFTVQSGPGLHIPNGIEGPGNVRPTPSLPIRGSTYVQTCATPAKARARKLIVSSNRLFNSSILQFFNPSIFLPELIELLEAVAVDDFLEFAVVVVADEMEGISELHQTAVLLRIRHPCRI